MLGDDERFEASVCPVYYIDGFNPFGNVLIVSKARFGGPTNKKVTQNYVETHSN